ncbi:helix-turn-helix domain-containing protein [Candidatus Frankia alpina]|uniref:helix-turn-helix domain-containing protein n=1 Tax=Candidatus Frankia alpina TaxID=2699483 RepID=UPI001F2EA77C
MPARAHRRQHPRRPRRRPRPRPRRRPRLTVEQAARAQQLYDAGTHTVAAIAALFDVPRSTVYGHLDPDRIGDRHAGAGRVCHPEGDRLADEGHESFT